MYGRHVHEQVFLAKERETGITIHFVNEIYDDGKIIFQAKCLLKPNDSIKSIAKIVRDLVIKFFPRVIENILNE